MTAGESRSHASRSLGLLASCIAVMCVSASRLDALNLHRYLVPLFSYFFKQTILIMVDGLVLLPIGRVSWIQFVTIANAAHNQQIC